MRAFMFGLVIMLASSTAIQADTVFVVDGRTDCAATPPGSGPTLFIEAGTHTLEYLSGAWSLWSSNGANGGLTWVTPIRAYIHATGETIPMFGTGVHPSFAVAQAAAVGQTHELDVLVDSNVSFLVTDGACSDNRGAVTLSLLDDAVVAAAEHPAHFELAPNSPNPFNPSTELRFQLEATAQVELAVYNLAGARVALLVCGLQERGEHSVRFQAEGLPSGTYFARLSSEGRQQTRKLLLLK